MARKGLKFDFWLCLGVLGLVGIGVVLIYSSSAAYAEAKGLPESFYLVRHAKKVLLGFIAFLIGLTIPYKFWERMALPLALGAAGLLLFLAVSGMGRVHGARRWIQFASFGLQPSELAKLALVFYLARRLCEKEDTIHLFRRGLLATLPLALVLFVLILKQPNYSTAATVLCITVALVYLAGCRVSHLALLGVVSVPVMAGLLFSSAYRLRRVMAFLDPDANPASSYQSLQALISLGNGGLLGTGLGSSTQKLGYLPMPFTDMVFSILGEELGFAGTIGVLLLFAFVVWRGFRIAFSCPDRFGSLAAGGLTVSLAVNVVMHVGVCVKLFPTTGQTLPFISYGGTSLIANLFAMGVLLNISGSTVAAPATLRAAKTGAPVSRGRGSVAPIRLRPVLGGRA